MNKDLQNKLYEKYPVLFENRTKSAMESCMAWGVECGDGWYEIISNLCYEINQHENNLKNQKKLSEYYPVRFDQIKEKFGGLRVYYSGGDDFVHGVASMAEAISYKTCELCGDKGKPNKEGWISTLCEKCNNKRISGD
jgi:hypothetical protein